MERIYIFLALFFTSIIGSVNAQTISTKIIDNFNPSTVRNVYEIIRYVPLSESKQIELAKLIELEDIYFAKQLKEEQVISLKSRNVLTKMRKENLEKILTEEELDQYYRGISDSEAEAMAADVRDKVKNS